MTMEAYTLDTYLKDIKPDASRLSLKVLREYYDNYVCPVNNVIRLTDGKAIHLTVNPNSFSHALGIHHNPEYARHIFNDMFEKDGAVLGEKEIVEAIKGKNLYDYAEHSTEPIDESMIGKFHLSRICRFNRIHQCFSDPQHVVRVTSEDAKRISQHGIVEGDVLVSRYDHSKLQTCVITRDDHTNSWYFKSFLVDRPQYTEHSFLIEDSRNMLKKALTFKANDHKQYVNYFYKHSDPYVKNLSSAGQGFLYEINSRSDAVYKLGFLKSQNVRIKAHLKTGLVNPDRPIKLDKGLFSTLKTACKLLDRAETEMVKEVPVKNQIKQIEKVDLDIDM